MKLQLPVRKEFPYDKIGSWGNGNPFTICYVYPKTESPFILKGGLNDISKWFKSYNVPCLYYQSMWFHGLERGYWNDNITEISHNKYGLCITQERVPNTKTFQTYGESVHRGGHYIISVRDKQKRESVFEKRVRRHPRSWIKELNAFV